PEWLLEEEKFGIEQQIKQLEKDVQDYNDLAAGKKKLPSPTLIVAQIPDLLVSCRIAKHWTQKELAERVGMPENQIQRYESQNYASVSLNVINRIATVLQNEDSEERHPASVQ
ncbi:MAG: helix-turn-helix domain-containing protein, partial [Cyanobacteria bacterium REEB67]|nr:helix-turn-helix domain-containing protein [Cyanobacteria bacterium REEB67]